MSFVEYLVILLLVGLGVWALLSWWPWERWSRHVLPPPPPREQAGDQGQAARGQGQGHPQPPAQALAPVPAQPAAQPRAGQDKRKVYFTTLGKLPSSTMDRLAAYYRDKYGLQIEVLPEVEMDRETFRGAFDASRRQLIGEELISVMRRHHPAQADDPDAILIGITRGDMYLRFRPDWGWAFAMRREGRFAVVSTARMDPRNFGEPPDPELLQTRLQKVLSKQIGALVFHLPESQDKRSVMFSPILGLDDLDSIGEDF